MSLLYAVFAIGNFISAAILKVCGHKITLVSLRPYPILSPPVPETQLARWSVSARGRRGARRLCLICLWGEINFWKIFCKKSFRKNLYLTSTERVRFRVTLAGTQ